jgi:hypothetical protein
MFAASHSRYACYLSRYVLVIDQGKEGMYSILMGRCYLEGRSIDRIIKLKA